ncbi:MAG TPA: dephospho-CoA kinase [Prolixibacteraceae bacterium]|nr:dephospho-CoA kinase [Prolixibacteraceae bacterium]
MQRVAVTGGIGSGKTWVCSLFEKLGVPVFEADRAGKEVLQYNPAVIQKLLDQFGPDVYLPDGTLHRKWLAHRVFNDHFALAKLNEIVHPEVRQMFELWLLQQHNVAYVIQETALVFESGIEQLFDQIILVTAPESLRIERIMKRDVVSREHVRERIRNQLSDEVKIGKSDYVICNDERSLLLSQIINIHNNLIENGKIW